MIKNNIFENSKCVSLDRSGDLYFSDLAEMGDFEELVYIFEDLKKTGKRVFANSFSAENHMQKHVFCGGLLGFPTDKS